MALITVEFFGRLSDRMGNAVRFELSDATTLGAVRAQLAKDHSVDDLLDPSIRGVINDVMVKDDTPIKATDNVAFFSPLSGG